jgi:protein-disulfide isomerase
VPVSRKELLHLSVVATLLAPIVLGCGGSTASVREAAPRPNRVDPSNAAALEARADQRREEMSEATFESEMALLGIERATTGRASAAGGASPDPAVHGHAEATPDASTEHAVGPRPASAPPASAPRPTSAAHRLEVPADAPTLGPDSAPVTIHMFTDFECSFCGHVRAAIETLVRAYPREVRLVFRNYPLPFHRNAALAHEAAWEVLAQRGERAFWRYQEALFDHQRQLDRSTLERLAGAVAGLDMARFTRALDRRTHQPRIERDIAAADELGSRIGTPTFFINGRLLRGAQPYEVFEQAVEAAMATPNSRTAP